MVHRDNGRAVMAFAVEPPVPPVRQSELLDRIRREYPAVTLSLIGNGAINWRGQEEPREASIFVVEANGNGHDDHYSYVDVLPDSAVATALAAHPNSYLDLTARMALISHTPELSEFAGVELHESPYSPDMVGTSGRWDTHPMTISNNFASLPIQEAVVRA